MKIRLAAVSRGVRAGNWDRVPSGWQGFERPRRTKEQRDAQAAKRRKNNAKSMADRRAGWERDGLCTHCGGPRDPKPKRVWRADGQLDVVHLKQCQKCRVIVAASVSKHRVRKREGLA
jgi:hypothetical protein